MLLAPNAKLRPEIILSGPVNANNTMEDHAEASHHSAPTRISWARLGGVEGCYYAPPLPVRSGRATFSRVGAERVASD
jgi:hypothetical protein